MKAIDVGWERNQRVKWMGDSCREGEEEQRARDGFH